MTMPTSASTGTSHTDTTKTDKAVKPESNPDDGTFPRRNHSIEDGTVIIEERRPGSKRWVEVERR